MYGIEYSTFASIIQNEDLANPKKETEDKFTSSLNSTAINSIKSDYIINTSNSSTSNPAEFLLHRLQSLSDCPEYLIPNLSYKNSSQSLKKADQNHYTDDFILLSEFSEIEGPKPLLTIPTDGGTGFNKNEYSLHLMCVDFHSHQTQQNQNNSKFSLTKDTSIINYWDHSSGMVTACVQHFTLYDLEARGFVRPFCLAYVSYDEKPLEFFEQMREKFSFITDLFKKSNFNQFKQELEQKCSDLKFTREFFTNWFAQDSTERLRLATEQNLDSKTFARLTASCTNETNKYLQLNAIDNMILDLEGILEVVTSELKLKNWFKIEKVSKINLNSQSMPRIDSFGQINENKTNRAMTYPTSNQKEITIRIDKNSYKKKLDFYRPKICTSILVGNANICPSSDLTNFNLNSEFNQRMEKKKSMKRLHQLSVDTAKQAINELRLMQRHFSTPSYLLKYKKLTQTANESKSNLFWSITIGDCIMSDFSTSIDTLNLNKQSFERKTNSFRSSNENTLIQINQTQQQQQETVECSSKTQFYSPYTEKSVYIDAIATSNQSTSVKRLETISSLGNSNKNISWSNLEQFLDSEEEEEEEEEMLKEEESEDFYSNQEILYDETVELTNELNTREENEYDFANSLLTIEYRPYNQYATNLNFNNLHLSTTSLALSLSSSSVGLYYKALNSLKFQSNLTDKLIQIQEFNFEETLKKLINSLPNIFPHLLYSLLKGRPVVCVSRYCSDLAYLQAVVDCLSNFLPNSFYCLNSLTMSKCLNYPKFATSSPNQQAQNCNLDKAELKSIHQRKAIRLNDLKYCKLFGLNLLISKDGCCSNECNDGYSDTKGSMNIHKHKHYHLSKSQDDTDLLLIYIPITIRNYVSILDLDNLTFLGPKYQGSHLTFCLNKCKQMQQDSLIYLYLVSNVINFYIKMSFLYNYSILFEHDSNEICLKRSSFDPEFMNKSVQITEPNQSSINHRKMSYQHSTTSSNVSATNRKDRILRFYTLIKNSSSQFNSNRNDIDLNLLKAILATVTISNSQTNTTSPSFDASDLKIVLYILKTLKIKQIYLYNLALHKKELKQLSNRQKCVKQTNLIQISDGLNGSLNGNSKTLVKTDIQFPLLIEYEELSSFSDKKVRAP